MCPLCITMIAAAAAKISATATATTVGAVKMRRMTIDRYGHRPQEMSTPEAHRGIAGGWPEVLSNPKTLLERVSIRSGETRTGTSKERGINSAFFHSNHDHKE